MLERLLVRGFKSLEEVDIRLKRLVVLFGPNASGKSNFIDALQVLSRCATERTMADVWDRWPQVRGYPSEAFTLPDNGLEGLFEKQDPVFEFEADVILDDVPPDVGAAQRYRLVVGGRPAHGSLSVVDEFLGTLTKPRRELSGRREVRTSPKPTIERGDECLVVRRKGKQAHPHHESLGLNHTVLSDLRYSGDHYKVLDRMRDEMAQWRTYYFDPMLTMRLDHPPHDASDIGSLGQALSPFLYRLKNSEKTAKHFGAVVRLVRQIIPSIDDVRVELDTSRGIVDLTVVQNGVPFSSRVVSEGTLRVLSLCSIACNPWSGGLIALEEPENGVHPRRLERIADLLYEVASESQRQVVVTTHSPLFVERVIRLQRQSPDDVVLYAFRSAGRATVVEPFRDTDLFNDEEIAKALAGDVEDGLVEQAMVRGWLDG